MKKKQNNTIIYLICYLEPAIRTIQCFIQNLIANQSRSKIVNSASGFITFIGNLMICVNHSGQQGLVLKLTWLDLSNKRLRGGKKSAASVYSGFDCVSALEAQSDLFCSQWNDLAALGACPLHAETWGSVCKLIDKKLIQTQTRLGSLSQTMH